MLNIEGIKSIQIENITGYSGEMDNQEIIIRSYLITFINDSIKEIEIASTFDKNGRERIINDIERRHEVIEFCQGEEIAGYRLVEFNTGRMGYLDHEGKLLRKRFDLATTFNKHGYAIVSLHGQLFWIDNHMKIVNVPSLKHSKDFVHCLGKGCDEIILNPDDESSLISYYDYDIPEYVRKDSMKCNFNSRKLVKVKE